MRILRLFGSDASRVYSTAGPEQEYFLIDKNFYFARPDLINAGRTLFGAKPPKGQEMEDHYFGAIPERVLACMLETETELYKLGVPGQDPAQRGLAGAVRAGRDVRERQRRHRPQHAGHGDDEARGRPLRPPAPAAREAVRGRQRVGQAPQLVAGRRPRATTCSSRATRRTTTPSSCSSWSPSSAPSRGTATCSASRSPTRTTTIGWAPTRPRRRSSRSSWATCSRTSSSRSRREAPRRPRPAASSRSASRSCRPCRAIAGDRNRTSPFAFTGNKFEFRAVGSSQSVAGPIVVLNTIVAESLDDIATQLEQAVAAGKDLNAEIQTLLQNAIKESKHVIFNGDNYSEAWHAEAERRGLPNRRNAIDSLPDLISPKSVKLFGKYGVFNERELHSRYEIFARELQARRSTSSRS